MMDPMKNEECTNYSEYLASPCHETYLGVPTNFI